MPRDGAGNYSVPNTFLPNTVMSATAVNENFTDAGAALTGSLARDGQTSMSGQFKAAAGTVGAPGIAFGVDTDTGFRRASEDEIRWVGGGVDRFYIDSAGKAFHLGDMDIGGDVGLVAPLVIATSSNSLLVLRRTENDTTARTVEEWALGSGAGAHGSLQAIGDGNNAVQTLRWRVNAVTAFETTQSLFTAAVPMTVGSNIRINTSGYMDFPEVVAPSNPDANVARLYAVDFFGTTKLQFRDSSGNVTNLPPGVDAQVFTASGTWNKPNFGTIALVQVWGAGASGGKGGSGDAGGGGGGGAMLERWIAVASLSSAVSVTVGAGGASQTTDSSNGNGGGVSSFGSYLIAGGGGAGAGTGTGNNAGGGGGGLGNNSGSAGSTTTAGSGGLPRGVIGSETTGASGNANPFGGGSGSDTAGVEGGTGLYGGGGGGLGFDGSGGGDPGGASVFGGAGGGGGAVTAGTSAGGTAIVYGGNGGAGNFGANNATAGTAPAGGGGGSCTGNSGAGARGEVRVYVW